VNQYGQSRKHIFDSVQQSLKRLQLDYIDVLQCSSPFSFFIRLLCVVGNRRSLPFSNFNFSSFLFLFPQAIVLIIIRLLRKWYVLDDIASNCGGFAIITQYYLLPLSPIWQMQALHDVVQKGWVHYIGMSSCWAYQCMHPSLSTRSSSSAN
jgi:aryl-alcohol dehydrogenase-like predicted oxidoreductase